MRDVLVIGASQAGVQLAVSLREGGFRGTITLVGAETHQPYQRPPLSKAFLAGKATPQTLALRRPEFYAEQGIDLLCGVRVSGLDLDAGKATTDATSPISFDHVGLATGARVRRLDLPGSMLPGVLYLRDLRDAEALRTAMDGAGSVVVIGGGFIGLEAAAVARAAGKQVTVVEASDRLVPRAVAPLVSQFLRDAHERRGTRVILSRTVTALEGEQRVHRVVLDDGAVLAADLVVVGIGVTARAELAAAAGLRVTTGIVVDDRGRTSDSRVVAAGDCTVQPHPSGIGGYVQLESVQNAVDQAKAAAASLLGIAPPTGVVPWFWSDQDDLKLQIAGLSTGYDDVVVRGNPDTERFSAVYYRDGRLIAADCVNRAPDYMSVRRALSAGLTIPRESAADDSVPLKNSVIA